MEFDVPSNPYEGLGWKGAAAGWDAPETIPIHADPYVETFMAPHAQPVQPPSFEAYGSLYSPYTTRLAATPMAGYGSGFQPSWASSMPPTPYSAQKYQMPYNPATSLYADQY